MKCALYLWSPTISTTRFETVTLLAPSLPVTALSCNPMCAKFRVPRSLAWAQKFLWKQACMNVEPSRSIVCHTVPSLRISFTGRLPSTYALRYMCLFNLSKNISTVPGYQVQCLEICTYITTGASSAFIMCRIVCIPCLNISVFRVFRIHSV
jgi:hypothetical protein